MKIPSHQVPLEHPHQMMHLRGGTVLKQNGLLDATEAKMVLTDIVGEKAAARAVNGDDLLEELEVEVMNLTLAPEINLKLHMCQHYFTEDGAKSVALNLIHSKEV